MPNCTYCGKPAGLFRRHHPECRAQFERATSTIPAFFEKLLDSTLPADRFEQLLNEVAATFHIGPRQLRALSVQGVNAMVQAALAQRLMTMEDEDRILEIAGALRFSANDVPGLEDKLVKIGMLRDLEADIIPDRVTVVGPMPFKLDRGETVVWIFNNIKSYRQPKAAESAPKVAPPLQREMPDYISPASPGEPPLATKGLIETGGDLMITDRHALHIISDQRQRKIPLSDIGAFHTYSDGFQIVRKRDSGPLSFVVDDPWFGANLIVRLLRLSSNSGPRLEATALDAAERPEH